MHTYKFSKKLKITQNSSVREAEAEAGHWREERRKLQNQKKPVHEVSSLMPYM